MNEVELERGKVGGGERGERERLKGDGRIYISVSVCVCRVSLSVVRRWWQEMEVGGRYCQEVRYVAIDI
jgi:hypothetical protein